MKYTTAALAGAALVGSALAKSNSDDGTFAVMRFNGKETCKGRMDPIVSFGERSAHVHSVFGGGNFGINADGKKLAQSSCTSAKVKGDKSAYWTPSVYFHDEDKGTFEPVPVMYTNVYYFFEATDDQIVSFPLGLSMVSGDAMTRVAPASGAKQCLDPADGDINAAHWTCPRNDPENPRSWPQGSDGSMAGIGDAINLGQGVGFPFHHCDALYSPLRADIHFPSCYNPEAGLTNFMSNMAFPSKKGASSHYRSNCPEGWLHVPHLFMEVYWDTDKFKDRWVQDSGSQPFVLSNGDATGFSIHADFMSGWDEDILQNIIDNCNSGHAGVHDCPGIKGTDQVNDDKCTCEGDIFTDEDVDGTLEKLPGDNPLAGWKYGAMKNSPSPPAEQTPPAAEQPAPTEEAGQPENTDAPEGYTPPSNGSEQPKEPPKEEGSQEQPPPETPTTEEPTPEEPEKDDNSAEKSSGTQPEPEKPSPETTAPPTLEPSKASGGSCKIQTVWETVTVTADGPEPTGASNSTGSIGGFQLAGCFKDAEERVLAGDSRPDLGPMSNEKCIAHCKDKGFALAGTEYAGQCYCGNELVGSAKLEDTKCDMACEGDSADICGGTWAISVYSADGEASIKTGSYKRARRHAHNHHNHHARRHLHSHH